MKFNPETNTRCVATYSIVGYDPETGEIGVAVQSKFPCVGSVVPWVKAGVGAVATQSWANTSYGPDAWALLEKGFSPVEVVKELTRDDEHKSLRQVGLVDAAGESATFTGDECMVWAGGISGPNFAAQGNVLVGPETVQALGDTFMNAEGDLAERLTLALLAAQAAGGDRRGMQSAALYIAKEGAGYGGWNDRYIDIRVDEHDNPIAELRRILAMYRILFYKTKPGNLMDIEGETQDFLLKVLVADGYFKGDTSGEWNDVKQAGLEEFYLTENYDERMAPYGKIDREVIEYLQTLDY